MSEFRTMHTGLRINLGSFAFLIVGLTILAARPSASGAVAATKIVPHARKTVRHRKHDAGDPNSYHRLTPAQKQTNQHGFKSLRRAYYRFHHKGGVGGI